MIYDISLKTVLVTGADGFVGGMVASKLSRDKRFKTVGTSLSEVCDEKKEFDLVTIDITDFKDVRKLIEETRPDIVYHFAAQSSAGYSFSDASTTFKVNFEGTINFLETMRETDIKFIYVSSSEVYGDTGGRKATENDLVAPLSPYGASKAAAEIAVLQYSRSFNMNCSVIRPFPQVGKGQNGRFFIPSMAKQIMDIKKGILAPEIKTGNLGPVRTYISVEDAVVFYLAMIDKAQKGEIYNLAGRQDISLLQILNMMKDIAGVEAEIVQSDDLLRASDPEFQLGSPEKIEKTTGYTPKRKIEDEIREILDNYR
ncbi:GDP-mannose 4,6-dehydratase [candidate division WOR-3 bacterium]|nr:GDP-mannose 4,6-dehydratase [candidate division WOR-3 bacterium]